MSEPALFLLGPRGAGKSTLGRLLAEHWRWAFVDADRLLEERAGWRLRDWLPADMAGFREAEGRLLAEELLGLRETVVALGGGIVEAPEARSLLARSRRCLALYAGPEELLRRQAEAPRPPLTGLAPAAEVRAILARRRPLYGEAAGGRWVDTGGTLEAALERLAAAAAALRETTA